LSKRFDGLGRVLLSACFKNSQYPLKFVGLADFAMPTGSYNKDAPHLGGGDYNS